MSISIQQLQAECHQLREKLVEKKEMEVELENLKSELEQALESHKRLQEVALALEEENRTVHEKYKMQLRERAKLDEINLDLETELESKTMNYDNLEKRFNKMKEKINSFENLEDLVYTLEKEKKRCTERIVELEEEITSKNTFIELWSKLQRRSEYQSRFCGRVLMLLCFLTK